MTNVAWFAERAMDRFGDYEAVTYVSLSGPDTKFRSGELYDRSVRFAAALKGLGVEPGDRVVVMIPNAPDITVLYSGIARCGAAILPILFLLADSEVRHILADARPKVVVTSPEFLEKVRGATQGVDSVTHIVCLEGAGTTGAIDFDDLIADAPSSFPIVERADSDLGLLIYTGGTTGKPKGVVLTHRNLSFAGELAAKLSSEENGISEADVTCSSLPLAHSYGVLVWLVATQIGGRAVLMRWFEPATWFRCVEDYAVTVSPMVPTMITYLLNHPDGDTRNTSSLRLVNSGAAPLPVEVGKAFEEKFGCTVVEGWGLTESTAFGTSNTLKARKWGSIGRVVSPIVLTIRDPDTEREMPSGEMGEICMRGDNVMAGYWNLAEETDKALQGGWLRTGDVGYIDPEGFVFIVDRVKDLIIRGGFNIYPRDVEEVLHRHPAVLEAAVVGVPDTAMGEEVKAFVVLKPGSTASEEELLEHSRSALAKYKTPKSVTFLDTLPKSGVGKILRRELRDMSTATRP